MTEIDMLLVEDNDADVELTLHALRPHRLSMHISRDGADAVDFLFCRGSYTGRDSSQRPRVVLLDLKLPKVDGLDVLRAIKGNPATRSIPAVILSSSLDDRDRTKAYDLGVNSFLRKPLDFESFRDLISKVSLYWITTNMPAPRQQPGS